MGKQFMAFIILAIVGISGGHSQDYLVIDTNQSNLIINDIYDTLWNSLPCDPPLTLNVDVDGDGLNDCMFLSECGSGSWGNEADLSMIGSFIDCFFVVDTMVVDSTLIIGTGEYIVDTFEVVEKYSYGDTILFEGPYFSNWTIMVHYHYCPPGFGPGSTLSLTDWIGGDHYIGIKKTIDDIEFLGWIKVEVVHSQKIIVKQSVYYNPYLGINDPESHHFQIYPNPVSDHFYFQNLCYETLKIINVSGQLCLDLSLSPGRQNIDISELHPGLYIIHLEGDHGIGHCKLIKQ